MVLAVGAVDADFRRASVSMACCRMSARLRAVKAGSADSGADGPLQPPKPGTKIDAFAVCLFLLPCGHFFHQCIGHFVQRHQRTLVDRACDTEFLSGAVGLACRIGREPQAFLREGDAAGALC